MKDTAAAQVIATKNCRKLKWISLLRPVIFDHYCSWYKRADPGSEVWPYPAQFNLYSALEVRIAPKTHHMLTTL